MGAQQRDQPLDREVFGRQCLVHVGRSCIPPRTLTIAGAAACTLRVQSQGTKFTCLGGFPGYCAPTFTLMRVGFTPTAFCTCTGLRILWPADPTVSPVSACCSSRQRFASGFLPTPGHPGNRCLPLTLAHVGCVEDFHLPVSAPCRAHQRNGICQSRCHSDLLRKQGKRPI